MKLAAMAAPALVAMAFLFASSPAARAEPEVTYLYPDEGATLSEPPPIVRFCFAEPVNTRDLHAGGDFNFKVVKPDGGGLGLRIVFRPDGLGVDVHLGLRDIQPDTYQGDWQLVWRVTDAYLGDPAAPTPPPDLEAIEGTLKFAVSPDGEAPAATEDDIPESCGDEETPPQETATSDDDDNTALVIGIALGAAALVLGGGGLFLLARRRAGSRRPPAGGGETRGGP